MSATEAEAIEQVALVAAFAAFAVSIFATWAALRQAGAAEKAVITADEANGIARSAREDGLRQAAAAEQAVASAEEANRIALSAREDARRAEVRGLWSDTIEAVHRLLIDPTKEPLGDKLVTLRVRIIFLMDGLPDWDDFDEWLLAEHHLGACIGRQIMEEATPGASVDERVSAMDPLMTWGIAFAQNLRHLRNIDDSSAIPGLKANTFRRIEDIYNRNKWGVPPPMAR